MNELVKKTCVCKHVEDIHKFRDFSSSHEILQKLDSSIKTVTVIRHPDRMEIVGYHIVDCGKSQYYTYEAALKEVDKMREEKSGCRTCSCKVFKLDNLKYLEDLDECSTS